MPLPNFILRCRQFEILPSQSLALSQRIEKRFLLTGVWATMGSQSLLADTFGDRLHALPAALLDAQLADWPLICAPFQTGEGHSTAGT